MIASLETKDATNLEDKRTCCKSKNGREIKTVNKVNTLGKVYNRKKKKIARFQTNHLQRETLFLSPLAIKVKVQLDTGSDINIIYEITRRKIGEAGLLAPRKVALVVSGNTLIF